jgi:hypothetical protein
MACPVGQAVCKREMIIKHLAGMLQESKKKKNTKKIT